MRALPRGCCSPGGSARASDPGPASWLGSRRNQHAAGDGASDARRLYLRPRPDRIERSGVRSSSMEFVFMNAPSPFIPIPRGPVPEAPPPRPRAAIEIKIDGQPVSVPEGSTILDAARSIGIDTPTLCFLESLTPV